MRRAWLYETAGHGLIKPAARLAYRIRVYGRERVPRSGGCILAANHESTVDPFVVGCVTSRVVRFMAKSELWDNRLLGFCMDGLGSFPVRRAAGDHAAAARGEDLLREGEVVAIFPEGYVVPRADRAYGRGAARLALKTGAPIVPVCLLHTERALRPGQRRIGFPRVEVLVGSPIRVEQQRATLVAARALTERIKEAIADLRRPYGPPAHVWESVEEEPAVPPRVPSS